MQPPSLDAGQRAALQRLQRAQLADGYTPGSVNCPGSAGFQPAPWSPAHVTPTTGQRAGAGSGLEARAPRMRGHRQFTGRGLHADADGYTLTPAHLTSPCRVAEIAEARQVAMWLMRTRLTWPLPTRTVAFSCTRIGRLRGHRDHSTVLHGVAVIAARLVTGRQEDAYLRQMVCSASATRDTRRDRRERHWATGRVTTGGNAGQWGGRGSYSSRAPAIDRRGGDRPQTNDE